MKYYLMAMEYLIPFLMVISLPWWKKIAKGGVNAYSGLRTSESMKNDENWKRANLLAGKYFSRGGIFLFIFVFVMRRLELATMPINAIIIINAEVLVIIGITIYINGKIKRESV